jgi:putative ABC transport system permease protein
MVNRLPLAGVGQTNLLEFETPDGARPRVASDTRSVTPDYFRTMGIPLVEGRFFTDHDVEAVPVTTRYGTLPSLAIVDEQIARTLWPGRSALGKRFRFAVDDAPWIEVIGVVGHIRHDGLDVDPRPQVYFNYLQRAQDRMALVVRGAQDVRALTPGVLQAVRDVDPEQPVYDVRTLEDVVDRSIAQRWLNMTLVTALAVIALVLASVGLYGVMAYGVTRQVREFGVRLALGARHADITRLVLGRGVALALSGLAIGVALAVGLARAMRSLLFAVEPADATSFAGSIALLVAVALLASYLPARRAGSVDPAITLRGE